MLLTTIQKAIKRAAFVNAIKRTSLPSAMKRKTITSAIKRTPLEITQYILSNANI